MQELRTAYRSIAWIAAIGGYLLLHYRQWQAGAGYVLGATFAAVALWSLQNLAEALGTRASTPWRWWWKGALWRYPLMLLILWLVSRQSLPFVMGFAAGVTLLPMSVGVVVFRRAWRRPEWLRLSYWAPKSVRRSRDF